MLRVGSLFSGIGMMDYGLQQAGMEITFQVEIDAFCYFILTKHFPETQQFRDIKDFSWPQQELQIDVLSGGMPCQPFSFANPNRIMTDDERYLWAEYLRVIRETRPRWIIFENVPGILKSKAFGQILGGLSNCGYDAEWECISASTFGAIHRRKRLFLIAYPNSSRLERFFTERISRQYEESYENSTQAISNYEDLRSRPNIPEPLVRRMGDAGSRSMDRVKSIGNAVYWPIIEVIGRRIIEIESEVE